MHSVDFLKESLSDAPLRKPDNLEAIISRARKGEIRRERIEKSHAAMQKRTQTAQLDNVHLTPVDYERILGTRDLLDISHLVKGLAAARSVGRVTYRYAGKRGYATGFLIAPRVLMTNWHVFKTAAETVESLIELDYERDSDGRLKSPSVFRFDPRRLFHSDEQLDFALVAIDPQPIGESRKLDSFGWIKLSPVAGKVEEGDYLTIIQHPSGEPKQIALRENEFIERQSTTIWYQTDTAPGSSGSPVFNDTWQLVALHNSGVPETDSKGRWLGPDGRPAPANPSEKQIKWKANQGIRISVIVEHLRSLGSRNELLNEVLRHTEAGADAIGGAPRSPEKQDGGSGPSEVRTDRGDLLVTVPVTLRIGLDNGARQQPALPPVVASAPARNADDLPDRSPSPVADGEEDLYEKFEVDVDYKSRKARPGYDSDFLGISVPMPKLSKALEKTVVRTSSGKPLLLNYKNYSLMVHQQRRMPVFAASNCDRSPERRGKLSRNVLNSGGRDKWILDPRLDEEFQIQNRELYAGTKFDLGHLVRREDAYWGDNEEQARLANFDTFHYTNATPQHESYNRSNEDGLWGRLENHIADQSENAGQKMCLFAGPIFDADGNQDPPVNKIKIPTAYWKVIVARKDAGGIGVYAFVLSQEKLIRTREDFEAAEWVTFQTSLKEIERATGLVFAPSLHASDAKPSGKNRKITSQEEIFTSGDGDVYQIFLRQPESLVKAGRVR
jgi:endonuclease G